MPSKEKSQTIAKYWQQQIEAWQASGLSQSAFCAANDLAYHRFGYWQRKLRSQGQASSQQAISNFVPALTYPQQTAADDLSLVLPSGLTLCGVTSNNLSVVCQLLARLS